jgi:hypothetical protein
VNKRVEEFPEAHLLRQELHVEWFLFACYIRVQRQEPQVCRPKTMLTATLIVRNSQKGAHINLELEPSSLLEHSASVHKLHIGKQKSKVTSLKVFHLTNIVPAIPGGMAPSILFDDNLICFYMLTDCKLTGAGDQQTV